MLNVDETILSQYVNSPRIVALIRKMNAGIDPAHTIETFYRKVFDVATAEGWGLDCWGKIVGIGRVMTLHGDEGTFGFVGSELQPFNQGTFYGPRLTSTYTLADNAYRELIMLKAASNITDCSLPSLNRLMAKLYADRGKAYVIEVGTMKIRYVFEFFLQPYERALMRREDVPPKPAGVGYETLELDPATTFGFAGSDLQPFNQGTFSSGVNDAYAVTA